MIFEGLKQQKVVAEHSQQLGCPQQGVSIRPGDEQLVTHMEEFSNKDLMEFEN